MEVGQHARYEQGQLGPSGDDPRVNEKMYHCTHKTPKLNDHQYYYKHKVSVNNCIDSQLL